MDMPVLKIGGHSPRHPLIQGGMGVLVSGPKLAGAVARSGAIGTIASVGLAAAHPDFTGRNYFEINQKAIKEYLAEAREIAGPDGILAINCMVALTDYELHVRAACEGGAQIIISGAGLPLKLPEYTKDYPEVALVPIVSSAKAAQLIMRRWKKTCGRIPDGFVVETPLYAGGHLGARDEAMVKDPSLSLEVVVPELVSFLEKEGLDIPVIAAGGIWDREDVLKAFDLGAKGVQMGTRFAASEEGDADIRFKQAYVDATEDDVVLIHSPAGLPGRALRSPMVDRYLKGDVESKPCMANCLTHCRYRKTKETFCIAQALVDAYRGDWEHGLFFCGSNVTKVNSIEKVEDVIRSLFPE
ncbi:2-nitropropane dioxygenase NPD [Dethiosulfovibrio peptidovorans DSM 11002]|uniref:2-nitropropane dioxygenase NPD n=1 Tax=Dethiosulfovibrio peptidovorans DSM 11002 TaxID=469381 RepID=D2Z7H3_9BACT|nr:2-nitropropane dioxygenase NPD [Dethiosulfovibrio peptidovorans DSM 11002]